MGMEILKDYKGHYGSINEWHGHYLCVCPCCAGDYAKAFRRGEFPKDGFKTPEEAIQDWNSHQNGIFVATGTPVVEYDVISKTGVFTCKDPRYPADDKRNKMMFAGWRSRYTICEEMDVAGKKWGKIKPLISTWMLRPGEGLGWIALDNVEKVA